MQMQATAGYAGGQIPNPYMAYGAPDSWQAVPVQRKVRSLCERLRIDPLRPRAPYRKRGIAYLTP